MQHSLDFLVAATQVARSVGIAHVIVVGDAAGERGEQVLGDLVGAQPLGEAGEARGGVLVKPQGGDPVGQGRGGGRLLLGCLVRFITVAKRRWRGHGRRLLF